MVTVIELNIKCKKLGLKGYTRLSKADLLKLVAKHDKTKTSRKEMTKETFKKNEELQIIQALSSNKAIQRKTLYNKVNLNEAQFGRTLHRLMQKEEVEAIKKYKPHPSGRGLSREYKMTYRLGWKLRKPKCVIEVLKSPGIKMREKFEFDKYGELRKARKIKPRVKLVGTDGNAFAIIGKVRKALMKAGLHNEADKFVKEATGGDYDNVLRSAIKYADVY